MVSDGWKVTHSLIHQKIKIFLNLKNKGSDFSSALTSKEAMANILPPRNYWSQGVDNMDSLGLVKIQGHLIWRSESSPGPILTMTSKFLSDPKKAKPTRANFL